MPRAWTQSCSLIGPFFVTCIMGGFNVVKYLLNRSSYEFWFIHEVGEDKTKNLTHTTVRRLFYFHVGTVSAGICGIWTTCFHRRRAVKQAGCTEATVGSHYTLTGVIEQKGSFLFISSCTRKHHLFKDGSPEKDAASWQVSESLYVWQTQTDRVVSLPGGTSVTEPRRVSTKRTNIQQIPYWYDTFSCSGRIPKPFWIWISFNLFMVCTGGVLIQTSLQFNKIWCCPGSIKTFLDEAAHWGK